VLQGKIFLIKPCPALADVHCEVQNSISKTNLLLCSFIDFVSIDKLPFKPHILSIAHAISIDVEVVLEPLNSKTFDFTELLPEHRISIKPCILSSVAYHFKTRNNFYHTGNIKFFAFKILLEDRGFFLQHFFISIFSYSAQKCFPRSFECRLQPSSQNRRFCS